MAGHTDELILLFGKLLLQLDLGQRCQAQFHLFHHDFGQVFQDGPFVRAEFARLKIDRAQGTDQVAVFGAERRPCIKTYALPDRCTFSATGSSRASSNTISSGLRIASAQRLSPRSAHLMPPAPVEDLKKTSSVSTSEISETGVSNNRAGRAVILSNTVSEGESSKR